MSPEMCRPDGPRIGTSTGRHRPAQTGVVISWTMALFTDLNSQPVVLTNGGATEDRAAQHNIRERGKMDGAGAFQICRSPWTTFQYAGRLDLRLLASKGFHN